MGDHANSGTSPSVRSVAFITMGCAKNEVDSAKMSSLLKDAGYSITDDLSVADAVVINTCSFIQSATEESIDAILETLDVPFVSQRSVPVIVSGCMPARYGDSLQDTLPEVASFLPCADESNIVQVVSDLIGGSVVEISTSDPGDPSSVCKDSLQSYMEYEPDSADDGRVFAYVKISDGCDRWCSYCTIPKIRGRYRSFSYEDIRSDVLMNVQSGKKEIILIGQDTGRWGQDLDDQKSLAWLLEKLCEEFADVWFRVMYIQPEGITDELLDVIARCDNACKYLDIPLQHVQRHILKAMNRKGSADEFEGLLDRINRSLPEAALRTTLITGFPGESAEDFAALEDFVSEGYFDYIGVFPYSREEGTKASELEGQIPDDEKLYRAQTLRELADAVCSAKVTERIGRRETVLIEGEYEDGQLFGRCQLQAPEVDGVTFVSTGVVGEFLNAEIIDTLLYDMEAEIV